MNVLAFETSGRYLGIAIAGEKGLLAEATLDSSMNHLGMLLPVTQRLLNETGLALKDIDGYAVSIGPGSFTGLRVGVATVKGLCLPDPKPVAAVPTLDVLAWNHAASGHRICAVMDAKREQVYACFYRSSSGRIVRESKYMITAPAEVLRRIRGTTVLTGDGTAFFKRGSSLVFAPAELNFPRASIVAVIGRKMLIEGKGRDARRLKPLYLYQKKCIIRKKQGRQ